MLLTFGLGTNLVQAVVIRLSALLSRKMRNRLAHALNGNSAMLGGNEAVAPLCVVKGLGSAVDVSHIWSRKCKKPLGPGEKCKRAYVCR